MRRAVEDLVSPFLPVFSVAKEREVRARLGRGDPLLLDVQLDRLARAFVDGQLVRREPFVAALAEQRVVESGARRPLRAGASHPRPGPAGAKAGARAGGGRAGADPRPGARARPADQSGDRLRRGDQWLDPLQFTLLLYSLGRPGASVSLASILPEPAAVLALLQDAPWWRPSPVKVGVTIVTGFIGKAVELPLTWGQAAQTALCASVILNAPSWR